MVNLSDGNPRLFSSEAVSYTHLDVYKRQPEQSGINADIQGNRPRLVAFPLQKILRYFQSVSYTHLHYDPLNEFEGNYIYDGLEWGLGGQYLNSSRLIQTGMFNWERVQGISGDWENVYYNGYEATINIITTAGQTVMNLNEKPESAAEYCYNKNKRSEGGSVPSNTSGWFLPGIRQLEAILTTYYNTYPEFQNRFYWSSSAAKRNRVGYGLIW